MSNGVRETVTVDDTLPNLAYAKEEENKSYISFFSIYDVYCKYTSGT
jgi:hypothetical protein